MSTDVAVKHSDVEIDEKKIVEFMDASGVGKELTAGEKKQFIEVSRAYQLNPFKREIYCIPYGKGQYRRLSIITGYEVYLKRAERTGSLDGWHVEIEGNRKDGSLKAVVTIHRKDWSHPFVHEAYWAEYKQDNRMWDSKPLTMIKKVAIAQAFRMCFPDEFGGMPYTSDELPDEMTQPRDVTDDASSEKKKKYTKQEDKSDPKSNPEDELIKELTRALDDAVLDGLIEKKDRDSVIATAKKAHGGPRQKYVSKVKEHLEQLRNENRQQAPKADEDEVIETEGTVEDDAPETIEDPDQLDIF